MTLLDAEVIPGQALSRSIRTIIFCTLLWTFEIHAQAVTYEFSGGRFGDNLIAYLHAKWFAYQHDVPLLYKPFDYSSDLVLDEKEIRYGNKRFLKEQGVFYLKKTHIKTWPFLSKIPFLSMLYVCPYFPEEEIECRKGRFFSFPVDWKEEGFRKIAREMIAPKEPLSLIIPPTGVISIAMHVREGGGFDRDLENQMPLKAPPKEFYIAGLRYMVTSFPGRSFYCYIFTDAKNPAALAEDFQKALPQEIQIEFAYRQEENRHDANVLEDFFSLFHFDLLIRPQSNFSIVPSLLHDYAIVYSPKNYRMRQAVITDVNVEFNKALFQELVN